MSQGLRVGNIVDRDDFNITALHSNLENTSSNPSKTIDCKFHLIPPEFINAIKLYDIGNSVSMKTGLSLIRNQSIPIMDLYIFPGLSVFNVEDSPSFSASSSADELPSSSAGMGITVSPGLMRS